MPEPNSHERALREFMNKMDEWDSQSELHHKFLEEYEGGGIEMILQNARELVADAELLLKYGRFARAVSLAILATEEAEKYSRAITGEDVRGLRNHKKKIKTHLDRLLDLTPEGEKVLAKLPDGSTKKNITEIFKQRSQKLREEEEDVPHILNLGKNTGLYAEVHPTEGFWYKPSDIIIQSLAEQTILQAKVAIGIATNMKNKSRKVKL